MIRPKLAPYQRTKQPSNSSNMSHIAALYSLPTGTTILDNQVAGHTFEDGKDTIGKHFNVFVQTFYSIKCIIRNAKGPK